MSKLSKFFKEVFAFDPISETVATTNTSTEEKKSVTNTINQSTASAAVSKSSSTKESYERYSETKVMPAIYKFDSKKTERDLQCEYLNKKINKLIQPSKDTPKRSFSEIFKSGDYKPMTEIPTRGEDYCDFWHFNEYMAHATGGVFFIPLSKGIKDNFKENEELTAKGQKYNKPHYYSNFYDIDGNAIPWHRPESDKYRMEKAMIRNKQFLDSLLPSDETKWDKLRLLIMDNNWSKNMSTLRALAVTFPSTKMTIADTLLPDYNDRIEFINTITEDKFGKHVAYYRLAAILACFMPLDTYDWYKTRALLNDLDSKFTTSTAYVIKIIFDWMVRPEVDAMLIAPSEDRAFMIERMTEMRNTFIEKGLFVFQTLTEEPIPYRFNRNAYFNDEYAKCLRDLADIKYPLDTTRSLIYTPDFLVNKGYNDRLVVTNGWFERLADGSSPFESGEYIYDVVNGASVAIVANDKEDMVKKMYTYVPELIKLGASVYFMPKQLSIIIGSTHWDADTFFRRHPELRTMECTSSPSRVNELYWQHAEGCMYLLVDRTLYDVEPGGQTASTRYKRNQQNLDSYITRFQTDLTYGELMRFLQDTTNLGMESHALAIHYHLKNIDYRRIQGESMRYALNIAVSEAIKMHGEPKVEWDYDRNERYGSITDPLPRRFADINVGYMNPQSVEELEKMIKGGPRRKLI